MISFLKAYSTEDGKVFSTIVAAQGHELETLLQKEFPSHSGAIAEFLVTNSERIVDILTTTGSSRPRGRRINGGSKKRTPKAIGTQPSPPSNA